MNHERRTAPVKHLARLLSRYPALEECRSSLRDAFQVLVHAFERDGTFFVCGNGGSAADAEHLVGELMKGFQKPRPCLESDIAALEAVAPGRGTAIAAQLQRGLRAISLVSQTSLMTAIANDLSGEMIFAQQLYAAGREGDVLVAISTSGNSLNVCTALVVAKAIGVRTIALTGRGGGTAAKDAEIAIRVPADNVADVQELHLPVYHWLATELEEHFFSDDRPPTTVREQSA